MLRTDSSNFNRLLTSLGLLLLGASLVVPYLFFRSTDVLQIPESQLNQLSPTAEEALRGRQEGISNLEPVVLGLAIVFAAVGFALLLWGGIRLREAQRHEDEQRQIRTAQMRRHLNPDEIETKRENEAVESLSLTARAADQFRRGMELGLSHTGDVKGESAQEREWDAHQAAQRSVDAAVSRQLAIITRIEERIAHEFSARDPMGGVRFTRNLAISGDEDTVHLDGLFESDWTVTPAVILELKVATGPAIVSRIPRNYANQVIAQMTRYERITGEQATPWLVVVIPAEVADRFDATGTNESQAQLAHAMGGTGAVNLVREDDLEQLPHIFDSRFRDRKREN